MEILNTLAGLCVSCVDSTKIFLSNMVSADFWISLLETYKYWIVIAGALLEGEMVLILAGAAAYHGHMTLHMVMLISFLGATFHDHLLFFIGRKYGSKILYRQNKWQERINKVVELIHKYDRYFIMSFRFIYGIRTITPIVIGASPISLRKYFSLVVVSAAAWSIIVSYIGYTFALALDVVLEKFAQYQKYLAVALVLVIGSIYSFLRWRRVRKEKKEENI
jgi:membrane protein DedA with SNARE-associated domain